MKILYFIYIFKFVQLPLQTNKVLESSSSAQCNHPSTHGACVVPENDQSLIPSKTDICFIPNMGYTFNLAFDSKMVKTSDLLKTKFPEDLVNAIISGFKDYIERKCTLERKSIDSFVNFIEAFISGVMEFVNEIGDISDEYELYYIRLTRKNIFLITYLFWNISRIDPGSEIWYALNIDEIIHRLIYDMKQLMCGKVAAEYENYIRYQLQNYIFSEQWYDLHMFLQDLAKMHKNILKDKLVLFSMLPPLNAQIYSLASIVYNGMFSTIRESIINTINDFIRYYNHYMRISVNPNTPHIHQTHIHLNLDLSKLSAGAKYSIEIFHKEDMQRMKKT